MPKQPRPLGVGNHWTLLEYEHAPVPRAALAAALAVIGLLTSLLGGCGKPVIEAAPPQPTVNRAVVAFPGQKDPAELRLAEVVSASERPVELAGRLVWNEDATARIYAPFAGRVAEQRVREQQYVQAGQPLLDILDDSVLELEFLVPSVWLRWVKPGGAFEVQIDETRKTYPARFTRLGARVDPVSQSVKAVAAIHGRFPELMAGMSGRVLITPPSAQ